MKPTTVSARRARPSILAALVAFLAAFLAVLLAPTPAHAAEGDPYSISGNVHHEGEPLEGVTLTIDGPGGEQEVETDAEGSWTVQVPERQADYVVTLHEDTLPETPHSA